MIIEILNQNCRVNTAKEDSVYVKQKDLLKNLNSIIEWEKCLFPRKLKEEFLKPDVDMSTITPDSFIEMRDFLGDVPELKPGNVFLWKGQIFGVDTEDSLILIVSETGPLAAARWETTFNTEIKLKNLSSSSEISTKIIDKNIIDPEYKQNNIQEDIYEIWKEKYSNGRVEKDNAVKIEYFNSDKLWFPSTIYIKDNVIYFDENDIDPKQIESVTEEIISWFYNNFETLELPKQSYKKAEQPEDSDE